MQYDVVIYIGVIAIASFFVRALPITLIRRQITNPFIRSFLYYVPYVTLSVMTFPAIVEATQSRISGIAALVIGCVAAYFGVSLFGVAVSSCVIVFIIELFII